MYRGPPLDSARQLYEKDLVLLADPPALIPPAARVPDHYRIVGPCFWEPDIPLPHELESLHNILFVSMGSTAADMIPTRLIEVLAAQMRPDAVIGVGKLSTDYKNMKCYSFLPNSKLLQRAVFAVTHGGTGSVYQALAHAVPVGCWPRHVNHRILGRRLEKLGFGIYIDPDQGAGSLEDTVVDAGVLAGNIRRSAADVKSDPYSAAREIAGLVRST